MLFQVFQVTVQVSAYMFSNDSDGFQVCFSDVSSDRSGVQSYVLNDLGGFQVYVSGVSGDRPGVQWHVFK